MYEKKNIDFRQILTLPPKNNVTLGKFRIPCRSQFPHCKKQIVVLVNYGDYSCVIRFLQAINNLTYENEHVVNATEIIVTHHFTLWRF